MMPSKQAFISDYFCSTKPKAQDDELDDTQPSRRQVAGAAVQTKNNHDNITDKNTTDKNTTTTNNSPNKKLKVAATLKSPPAEVDTSSIDMSYQSLNLLKFNRKNYKYGPLGEEIANPCNVATEKEVQEFSLQVSEANKLGMGFEADITPPLFRYMLQHGLKKVPREIEWQCVCKDPTLNTDYDPDKSREDYIRVGQNTDFFPLDGTKTVGLHGIAGGKCYAIDKRGAIHYPVVYYAHCDGFMVLCRMYWQQSSTSNKNLVSVKDHISNGTADILARRSVPCANYSYNHSYLVRRYQILKANPESNHKDAKRKITLSNEDCTASKKQFSQGAVILATHVSPRPDNHILQHDGERWEESLDMIRWLPRNENKLKENLDPDCKSKSLYTTDRLPIDEGCYEDETWYKHPTEPLQVNESGTHVFEPTRNEFRKITVRTWKNEKWVEMSVRRYGGPGLNFARFAVECFIGRKLFRGETVEHINQCRTNNSKGNLLARFMLFQGNNRKPIPLHVDGTVVGVSLHSQGTGWKASVRMITPDGPVTSVQMEKYFGFRKYGGKEKAKEAANAWRKTYTLKEGMVYV